MLPGFNHNIKYRNQVFHCQTEDSGVNNPHIITHLFVGGNILATKKTSYADIVTSDRLEEVVGELMQDQHKDILKKLISGHYDAAIASRSGNAHHLDGPAPLNVDAGAQNRSSLMLGGGGGHHDKPAAPLKAPVLKAPAPKAPAAKAPAPKVAVPIPAVPRVAVPIPVVPELPAATSLTQSGSMLPQEVLDAQGLANLPELKAGQSETIFGEDLISEKSLDEVILSYLATETDQ